MTALADVFERLTADPSFADDIRRNPAEALREFDLDASELIRLERALGSPLSGAGEYRPAPD